MAITPPSRSAPPSHLARRSSATGSCASQRRGPRAAALKSARWTQPPTEPFRVSSILGVDTRPAGPHRCCRWSPFSASTWTKEQELVRLAKLFGRSSPPPRVDRLVVGLRNPADGYANPRHNVGFQVANKLAKRARLEFDTKAAESRIAEGSLGDLRIAIARPQTFMNDSGRAVAKLPDRSRLSPSAPYVVFDDVDRSCH